MTNTEPSSERERAKMYLFFLGCFLIVFLFLDLNLKFFLQNFGILYVEENDDEKNFPRKKNFNQKKICWKFWFQCRMFAWKNGKISNFFQTHLNHMTYMNFSSNKTKRAKNVTFHHSIPSSTKKSLINSFEIHFFLLQWHFCLRPSSSSSSSSMTFFCSFKDCFGKKKKSNDNVGDHHHHHHQANH